MKKILVIDNYDSFTYNLVHYVEQLVNTKVDVFRNDEIELSEVAAYNQILLSPGPGIPVEAGICLDLIKQYAKEKSILGICLGHQAIAEAFDGRLNNLEKVYHGVATDVSVLDPGESLFKQLPQRFKTGRYHSWVVNKSDIPACFKVTCEDDQGMVMGIRHKEMKVKGLQFHPESVLTPDGLRIIENWLKN
jgi:anthranilate synthase component II